jgi:hypothetical protein
MADYGYCNTSIAAMRAEPSERSEMVSQLFFCEVFTILEDTVKWLFIRCENDGYTGWIDRKQYIPITDKEYTLLRGRSIAFPKELITTLKNQHTDECIRIFHGTPLPVNLQGIVEINSHRWKPEGDIFYRPTSTPDRKNIVETAKTYLHAPYLWGGKSIFGCDCSGFVQTIYNMNGITIKRDASQQAREGETVNLIDEATPGDLIFFDNHEGDIIHVGILIENNQIIHASGCVRIDKIDHFGIFNQQQQTYTHKLRIIKRYF